MKTKTMFAAAIGALALVVAAAPAGASAAVRTGSVQDPQGDVSALSGPLLDLKTIAVRYDDTAGTMRVSWMYYGDVRTGADPGSSVDGVMEASDIAPPGVTYDMAMVSWSAFATDDRSWSVTTSLSLNKSGGSLSGTGTISGDGHTVTAEFTNSALIGHDWRRIPIGSSHGDDHIESWFDGYSDPNPPIYPPSLPPAPGPGGGDGSNADQGMTINGGALYTNDPDVTLSVNSPELGVLTSRRE